VTDYLQARETKKGTIETEANGDSWRTFERGPSLVGLLDLSCR
jgi:hypothetical protein